MYKKSITSINIGIIIVAVPKGQPLVTVISETNVYFKYVHMEFPWSEYWMRVSASYVFINNVSELAAEEYKQIYMARGTAWLVKKNCNL